LRKHQAALGRVAAGPVRHTGRTSRTRNRDRSHGSSVCR
jgi:hypothetical protein